jgi:hypothetical protein
MDVSLSIDHLGGETTIGFRGPCDKDFISRGAYLLGMKMELRYLRYSLALACRSMRWWKRPAEPHSLRRSNVDAGLPA